MNRKVLFNGSFFILFAFMLYLAARLLWPSWVPLLGAAVLAIVFHPIHKWLGFYIRNKFLQALVSDLFVAVFFFLPVGWLVSAAVAQSDLLLPALRPIMDHVVQCVKGAQEAVIGMLVRLFPALAEQFQSYLITLQQQLLSGAARSLAHLPRLGAQAAALVWFVFLTIVALFFFFRDGEALLQRIEDLLPIRPEFKRRLHERLRWMIIGAVRGSMLTSLAQAFVATVGFLITSTPSAFLLGFLTLFVAVIPVIGSAMIWAPISLYYFVSGVWWKGTFLIIWGLLMTGSIDNLLRPWLVGFKQDIPFFWLFFSMVGGLQIFGLFGVLLGPLIMTVLIVLLDIYQHVYLERGHS